MTVWEYISASLLAGYWGGRADDDAAPEVAEASLPNDALAALPSVLAAVI